MTIHRRRSRLIAGVATALPAFLLAGLLVLPGAASAGEIFFGPDLVVSMSDDPDPVAPNGTVTITVLVANEGNDDSFDTFLDSATDGEDLVSAEVTDAGEGETCDIEGNTASCYLGFIPSPNVSAEAPTALLAFNEREVVFEVVAPESAGTFLSTAAASSVEQTDENEADNTDSETTEVSDEGSGDSESGTVPPGGVLTTQDGPVDANDPFAVALKNIGDEDLDATIEEEACDGTQEGDPLCSEPRVGGVAGDFRFEESGSESLAALVESGAIVIAKLIYDRTVINDVEGFRIFYQKSIDSPVIRLPRCQRPVLTECVKSTKTKKNGDQVVQVKLSNDPRVTRG